MKKHIINTGKPGDVWAIMLEKDNYGYIHLLKGACLGVFPVISVGILNNVKHLETLKARWFFGIAAPPTEKVEMLRIGAMPFINEEAAWPPARYLPPDIFKSYFRIFEKGVQRRAVESETCGMQRVQMATPTWLQQFILNNRRECLLLESGPITSETATATVKHDGPPFMLEIVFRNGDFPFSGRDKVEDPLAKALERAGVGEVTGGGSGAETTAIDVEVSDIVSGLEIIRQTLHSLSCPASTEIHQHQPSHFVHRL